jgi:3-hydroxybutyryl-CoA dehydratase
VTAPTLPVLEKRCDFATILAFAELSDDYNPIHIDRDFAATTEMGGIIAHGPMALGLMWEMLERAFAPERLRALALDVRFRRPVREDDVIRSGGEALADGAGFTVWIRNQHDEDVVTGALTPRAH